MGNKSRFVIAEHKIRSFFKDASRRVYKKAQLEEVLEQNRSEWNLPFSMNGNRFTDRLLNSNILSKQEIDFNGIISRQERFLALDASVFQIAVSLKNKSYLSHYSAVYL